MEPDLEFVGAGISLSQVKPMNQKRLLAFVNFWIGQQARGLGRLAHQTEEALMRLEWQLDNLELSLELLEAKLASVPELASAINTTIINPAANNTPIVTEPVGAAGPKAETTVPPPPPPPPPVVAPDAGKEVKEEEQAAKEEEKKEAVEESAGDGIPAKSHPIYARFFKMLSLGVPEPAVGQKMRMEGLDPAILANPDARYPAPDPASDESEEDSDFSD